MKLHAFNTKPGAADEAEANAGQAGKTPPGSLSPRLFGYDFFISFKLGPPPAGAQSYASDLARRLRERDFTVFFSEEEAPPGAVLDATLLKALGKSGVLVALANEGALTRSLWVRKEVEEFRRRHPARPVVAVNIGQALERFGEQADVSKWLAPEGRIWLDETQEALAEGIASPHIAERLAVVPRFAKANTKLRRAVAGALVTFAGLAAVAGYEAMDARQKLKQATALRLSAEGGAILSGRRNAPSVRGFLSLLAGHRLDPAQVGYQDLQAAYRQFRLLAYIREAPGATLHSLALSPDGAQLAAGLGDGRLARWDARDFHAMGASVEGHAGTITHLAYSPDGTRIVSSSEFDQAVRIWDAKTGAPGPKLAGGLRDNALKASLDGPQILAPGEDGALLRWEADTGKPINPPLTIPGLDGAASDYRLDGGQAARWLADNALWSWNAKDGASKPTPIPCGDGFDRPVFSRDGSHVAAFSSDGGGALCLWNIKAGKPGLVLKGHEENVTDFNLSPDGRRIVTASLDQTLRLWDAATGQELRRWRSYEKPKVVQDGSSLPLALFTHDGTGVISVGEDDTLRLWSFQPGQPQPPAETPNPRPCPGMACSPGGSRFVARDAKGDYWLWDAAAKKTLGKPLRNGPKTFVSAAFSPDGSRLAATDAESLQFWDARTGEPLGEPAKTRTDEAFTLEFSPDSRRLVSGGGFWDAQTGKPLDEALKGLVREFKSAAFSADSRRLVTAGSDGLLVWDARTGQPQPGCKPETDEEDAVITQVGFNPDGVHIAYLTNGNAVWLWNAATCKPAAQPLKPANPENRITGIEFDPSGKRVAYRLDDAPGPQYWWVLEGWAEQLCAKLERNMSRQEWRELVSPDIAYAEQCPGLPIPPDAPANPEENKP